MQRFAEGVSETALSVMIRTTLWVIPWIQIVHIVAMGLVLSSIFMIAMRMLRLAGRHQSIEAVARRFLPFVWWGLAVMLASGLLLIVGEPVRSLVNTAFWTKMALLAVGIGAVLAFQMRYRRDPGLDGSGRAKAAALLTFCVWCGVIIAGRWIAYAYVPQY